MAPPRESSGYLQSSRRPSSAASQLSRGAAHSGQGVPPSSQQSKKDRHAAALQLWNKWAQDALGSLTSNPTETELKQKSKRLQSVIRQSERLSASVTKRLSSMSEVRAEINVQAETSSSSTMKEPSRSARRAVLASRSIARSSMNDFLKTEGKREALSSEAALSKSVDDGREASGRPQTAPASAAPPRDRSGDMIQVMLERDSLRSSVHAAQTETAAQLDEKAELLATIDLLRAKLHAQDTREIEHQRRLQAYEKLEPIFNRLGEKFQFKSADEVIDRLEFLEDGKLNTYNQLLEAQSEIQRLEKALRDSRQQQATKEQEKENDFQGKMAKLQKQLNEARSEVEALGMELRTSQARYESSQALSNSVMNLWNKMHDNSEVMKQRPMSEDDLPVTDPLHMVQCIYELMRMHSVTATGMLLRDLSQVCNRIWAQHFSERLTIKGDIFNVVLALEEMANIMVKKLGRLTGQLNKAHEKEKFLSEDMAKLERRTNCLQSEHDRRNQLTRQSIRIVNQRVPLPGTRCPTCNEVVGAGGQRNSLPGGTTMSSRRTTFAAEALSAHADHQRKLDSSNARASRPTTADSGSAAFTGGALSRGSTRPSTADTRAGETRNSVTAPGSKRKEASTVLTSNAPRGAHWDAFGKAGISGCIDAGSTAAVALESDTRWGDERRSRGAGGVAGGLATTCQMGSVRIEVDKADAARIAQKLQL